MPAQATSPGLDWTPGPQPSFNLNPRQKRDECFQLRARGAALAHDFHVNARAKLNVQVAGSALRCAGEETIGILGREGKHDLSIVRRPLNPSTVAISVRRHRCQGHLQGRFAIRPAVGAAEEPVLLDAVAQRNQRWGLVG